MVVVRVPVALRQLEKVDERARARTIFSGHNYVARLAAIAPGDGARAPAAQVGKDLLVVVLQGKGFLRVPADEIYLEPGTVVRVPSGMPHQLTASGPEELVAVLVAVEVRTTPTVPTLPEALG